MKPVIKKRAGAKAPSFVGLSPSSASASRVKSRVGKRDTHPELVLRRHLWRLGLRFRADVGALAGRPDVVFAYAKVVVFCDGDFWHGRAWRARRRRLASGSNSAYWIAKIKANIARDRRHTATLEADGWLVIRLWESQIKSAPERVAFYVKKAVARRLNASE